MDWSHVNTKDLVSGLQKAEVQTRPWGEFFHRFSAPEGAGKALSRMKCNLYYYRSNYTVVFGLSTLIMLVRNPLGSLSLGLLAFAAMLYNDAMCSKVSGWLVAWLKRLHPKMAAHLETLPGGHDGCGVGAGETVDMKIAGQSRDTVAATMLGVGALVALATGALNTVIMGVSMGAGLTAAHSICRTPNLSSRMASTERLLQAEIVDAMA